ncbi:copper amine oxidase N-terminal domain-containing protein [Paenibacillus sp. FSL M7-1046]|uniref:copper amine oxidase N-terminal domain-containing protein n=1 Tax=Paenibacillus sp. FSL M7-1046 TaxID=2975315 RepID=UPI0030FADE0C
MRKIWLFAPMLLLLFLFPAISSAATHASFIYYVANGGKGTVPALVKSGTAFVPASLLEEAGLRVAWDKADLRAKYVGWEKTVVVTVGSKTAVLDGKTVQLGGAPFRYKEQLYLPARFVVQALEGQTVSWDAAHAVYTAKGLGTFASINATFEGITYSVVKESGKLYAAKAPGKPQLIAKLGSKLYDMVDFKFQKTPGGLIHLTLSDIYGEPHINNTWYTLVIKNGVVIRQASVGYYNRFGNNVAMYDNNLVLTDGKILRVIEDGTGKVKETLDLVKLGGEDDNYLVEGIDDDFLLIRPNQKGILMFIDRKTGGKTLLYKELLNQEQQQYAETNDVPYYGDELKFIKREGNTLQFKLGREDQIYNYRMNEY